MTQIRYVSRLIFFLPIFHLFLHPSVAEAVKISLPEGEWQWIDGNRPPPESTYRLADGQGVCLHIDKSTGQQYPGLMSISDTLFGPLPFCRYSNGQVSYLADRFWTLKSDQTLLLLSADNILNWVFRPLSVGSDAFFCVVKDVLTGEYKIGLTTNNQSHCVAEGNSHTDFMLFQYKFRALYDGMVHTLTMVSIAVSLMAIATVVAMCTVVLCALADQYHKKWSAKQ